MIIDPNTVVNHYSWERNSDAVRAFMNTNRDVMTDPYTQMVSSQDATDESQVVDMKPETDTPEGADEGQTGDQGGDADGQNFGQDQGEEDRMGAEYYRAEGGSNGGMSLMNLLGLGLVGAGAFMAVSSLMNK
tara:strand:- start:589 stop:984 length:396 start_codon:yes stop_codon:yes gene_type:complete